VVAHGIDEEEVLALAAAVESESEHPLAPAIVAEARQRGVNAPLATGFRPMTGRGVEATINGVSVAVGGPALLRDHGLTEPPEVASRTGDWRRRGAAVLHLIRVDQIAAALAVEDQIRPESREAVDALHQLGVRVVMITGDARQVANAVAKQLGANRRPCNSASERGRPAASSTI
jgi:Cu2+-exporting ATPase